jgi:hypothetical protein
MTAIDPTMGMGFLHGAESLSRLAANSFVSGLWQGIVLAVGVGLCLRLVPKATAAVRFAIWTAVFAVLAVLPLMHAYLLRAEGGMAAGHGAVVHVDVRWSFAIAAVWLIASLVRAIQLAMSAVRLRGIWKRAVPVEESDAILSAIGVRGVVLCTSRDVDRPSVIGFFSPRILIPEELFARLTTAEFGQIVLHEVGHLRRADDWINLLQKLSLVLVPLNPVLIWIERRLCLERELACDDDVLRFTKAPKAYATCLTNLAEQRLGRRAAGLSLGAWERRPELTRRVHSILRGGAGMGRTQARVLMGALVLGLLGGSAELARSPQLVSFSRSTLQVSAAAQSLPARAGYQAMAFRSSGNNAFGAAHETLLKASMPVNGLTTGGLTTGRKTGLTTDAIKQSTVPVKKAARHNASSVLRVRTVTLKQTQRADRWVVLTSWEEQERPRMIFAVTEEPVISNSYAAVPVAGGWLIIQL